MRVAAYQAPYRPYPASGGVELVLAFLEQAQADGAELMCCPEALIGELANETDGDSPSRCRRTKPVRRGNVAGHGTRRLLNNRLWLGS